MINCPNCGSSKWHVSYRCPIDPANDKFDCKECGRAFGRYDKEDDKMTTQTIAPEQIDERS